MARLLDWPNALRIMAWQLLSGPRALNGSSSESVTGFIQTVASPFGAWRWQLSIEPMKGRLFRRYRGMRDALNGSANAVRVPFNDPDGLGWAEAGVMITDDQKRNGVTWSNGKPWSNGQNWKPSRPWATISAAAAVQTTIVTLADEYWGHELDMGDRFGFVPFHFGLYEVTQVIAPGQYRIWPPLRKALAVGDYCTLNPTLAMRAESEQAATETRGSSRAESNTMTMVEVMDADVRSYFAD